RCAAFARVCFRPIRGLRMSYAVSVRTSAKPVLQSADNTNMWRLCGNVPRPAPAVLRRAGRLPKLGPFEKLHRTQYRTLRPEDNILSPMTLWNPSDQF